MRVPPLHIAAEDDRTRLAHEAATSEGMSPAFAKVWLGSDEKMLRDVLVVGFAMAFGFTLSGITANLYRLCAAGSDRDSLQMPQLLVMIFAGPTVLMANATRSRRARDCSPFAFSLASAIAGYWSFVLGLFLLNLGLVISF